MHQGWISWSCWTGSPIPKEGLIHPVLEAQTPSGFFDFNCTVSLWLSLFPRDMNKFMLSQNELLKRNQICDIIRTSIQQWWPHWFSWLWCTWLCLMFKHVQKFKIKSIFMLSQCSWPRSHRNATESPEVSGWILSRIWAQPTGPRVRRFPSTLLTMTEWRWQYAHQDMHHQSFHWVTFF